MKQLLLKYISHIAQKWAETCSFETRCAIYFSNNCLKQSCVRMYIIYIYIYILMFMQRQKEFL